MYLFLISYLSSYSQRLDNLGKAKPVTITGGISANTIFYDGTANREPFTYFLNGSINANIYGLYNIPVSFSYTNQQFNFNEPAFKINRLSLHPSYKWVTAHIGDVAMNFSPYTLNGHQFTGLGFDLNPNNPLKISAMYGRLVRNREYNQEEPEALPAYKRIGYGTKVSYEKPDYNIGLTVFGAKDEQNSLQTTIPDDLNITPKENLVLSFEGGVRFLKKGNINVEYATSALTNDIRSDVSDNSHFLSFIFNNKTSTSYYNAFNADLSYTVGRGTLGIGYERIDPQYQTLGAYFFNNDLENITAKISQTLFNNKLNLSVSTGLQRDDLNNKKRSKLSRIVTAVNVGVTASERLMINGSYSNFRTYTQIQNQFDYINEVRPYANLDTLNFTQISQNANLNFNYHLSKLKERRQAINLNLSYQKTNEKQDDFLVDINKNNSNFFNGNVGYTMSIVPQQLSITGAFNTTFNTIDTIKTTIIGPTIAVAKYFFDKKLRTSLSSAYNTTTTDGVQQGNILNFRLGSSYRYKEKHNFNLNAIQLIKNSKVQQVKSNDFTVTLGYSYTFSSHKKKQRKKQIIKEEQKTQKETTKTPVRESLLKLSVNKYRFDGSPTKILKHLDTLHNNLDVSYIDSKLKETHLKNYKTLTNTDKTAIKTFKENAKAYLIHRDKIINTLTKYQKIVNKVHKALAIDLKSVHNKFEQDYIKARGELNKSLQSDADYKQKKKKLEKAKKILMHHNWIVKQLEKPENEALKNIHIFKGSMLNEIENMKANGKTKEQIEIQLKLALIAYYDEMASKYATEKDIDILKTN